MNFILYSKRLAADPVPLKIPSIKLQANQTVFMHTQPDIRFLDTHNPENQAGGMQPQIYCSDVESDCNL